MAHKKFSLFEERALGQNHGADYGYCIFNSRGIVHKEFVLPGQTVNHAIYKGVLEQFQNESTESERTLRTIGCCTTITCQLTLRFQFENF
jgi:hypothetical protein